MDTEQVEIENPWKVPDRCINHYNHQKRTFTYTTLKSKTHYKGVYLEEVWGNFKFLSQPESVVAVLNGKAITECVTVAGAIRVLKSRGYTETSTIVIDNSPAIG